MHLLRNYLVINVLQDLLFCIPKAAVLHGKSVGFASQKSRFRNAKSKLPFSKEIIFTKQGLFSAFVCKQEKGNQLYSPASSDCLKTNIRLQSFDYVGWEILEQSKLRKAA